MNQADERLLKLRIRTLTGAVMKGNTNCKKSEHRWIGLSEWRPDRLVGLIHARFIVSVFILRGF